MVFTRNDLNTCNILLKRRNFHCRYRMVAGVNPRMQEKFVDTKEIDRAVNQKTYNTMKQPKLRVRFPSVAWYNRFNFI
jgi:hypothetical protein